MVEKGPREKPALTTPYYFLALIIIFYFIIYFISLFYAGFEVLIHFELKTTHTFTALLIRNIISVSEQPQLRQHMLLWNVNCSKNTFTSNKCLAPYTSLYDYMTLHDRLEPMLAKHKICCCLGHETLTD